MKRMYLSCLALLLCLLLTLPALAEEDLLTRLQPLMDEAVTELADGAAQAPYVGVRPMVADVSPEGDALVVLGDLYAARGPLNSLAPEEYSEVLWLDQRVVIQLQRSAEAWRVSQVRLDAELLMEDAVQAYFEQTVQTYASDLLGFSVQYPAVFTDLHEMIGGVEASLRDGSAAFMARREGNTEALDLVALTAREAALHPGAQADVNQAGGTVRILWREGDTTVCDVYAVTGQWIYHAQLRWQDAWNADFVIYSEYMHNSLCVDEFGIG